MGKRGIWLTILGVVCFLGFLLFQFPAGIAINLAESLTKDMRPQPRFFGVDGTLWHGEIKRLDVNGQHFNDVKWRVHPFALLWGNAEVNVVFRQGDNRGSAVVSKSLFGGLALNDLKARYAAQDLVKMANIPAVKLGGMFDLSLDELVLDGNTVSGASGVLQWQRASSEFPQKVELGDIKATLTTDKDGVKAKFSDAGGPLKISGQLLVTPKGEYKLNGSLAAREGPSSTLGRSLSMMGRADGQGNIALNMSGKLSEFGFLFK